MSEKIECKDCQGNGKRSYIFTLGDKDICIKCETCNGTGLKEE